MKQIFRCEYCDKMGIEKDILEHEQTCSFNHTIRSCSTCKHAENKIKKFDCKAGKEIPEGQKFINCDKYEWDEIDHTHLNPIAFNNLFGGMFG